MQAGAFREPVYSDLSIIFAVHGIYFASLSLRLLRLLHDHKVEIWKEKCSAGLGRFAGAALIGRVLPFSGQEGPDQSALELFLEGHLHNWMLPHPLFCHSSEPTQVYEGSDLLLRLDTPNHLSRGTDIGSWCTRDGGKEQGHFTTHLLFWLLAFLFFFLFFYIYLKEVVIVVIV